MKSKVAILVVYIFSLLAITGCAQKGTAYKCVIEASDKANKPNDAMLKTVQERLNGFADISASITGEKIEVTFKSVEDTSYIKKLLETPGGANFYPTLEAGDLIKALNNAVPTPKGNVMANYFVPGTSEPNRKLPFFATYRLTDETQIGYIFSSSFAKDNLEVGEAIMKGEDTVYGIGMLYLANISQPVITTNEIVSCKVSANDNLGHPTILLTLNEEAKKRFSDFTLNNIRKPVLICIDNQVISAPTINDQITGGKVQIMGNYSLKEAQLMAQAIKWQYPFAVRVVSIAKQ